MVRLKWPRLPPALIDGYLEKINTVREKNQCYEET